MSASYPSIHPSIKYKLLNFGPEQHGQEGGGGSSSELMPLSPSGISTSNVWGPALRTTLLCSVHAPSHLYNPDPHLSLTEFPRLCPILVASNLIEGKGFTTAPAILKIGDRPNVCEPVATSNDASSALNSSRGPKQAESPILRARRKPDYVGSK
jgi:hypothetical protein